MMLAFVGKIVVSFVGGLYGQKLYTSAAALNPFDVHFYTDIHA